MLVIMRRFLMQLVLEQVVFVFVWYLCLDLASVILSEFDR